VQVCLGLILETCPYD